MQLFCLRQVGFVYLILRRTFRLQVIVGTTGNPKGVLSTQRQFLTNIINASLSSFPEGRLLIYGVLLE